MPVDKKVFIAGGAASCTAEIGTFPIDLVKVRMQVQGQAIDAAHHTRQYKNLFHCFWKIATQEGPRKLYNGLSAAILRQMVYGTMRMGMYQNFKGYLFKLTGEESYIGGIFCGMTAGVISSCIANPTDVMRVRFQTNNARFRGVGLFQAFNITFKEEGFRGLYRGTPQTAQRGAIVSACEFPMYDLAKRTLVQHGSDPNALLTHFLGSCVAGVFTGVAVNPVDVIRARMMNQQRLKQTFIVEAQAAEKTMSAELPLIYKSGLDCLLTTVRTENIFALYKGVIPSIMRMVPWNVLFFMSYEQYQRFLS